MNKICPLMSTADKTVNCTENCAWYVPEGQITRQCAIFRVIDSIDYLESSQSSIELSSTSEE